MPWVKHWEEELKKIFCFQEINSCEQYSQLDALKLMVHNDVRMTTFSFRGHFRVAHVCRQFELNPRVLLSQIDHKTNKFKAMVTIC